MRPSTNITGPTVEVLLVRFKCGAESRSTRDRPLLRLVACAQYDDPVGMELRKPQDKQQGQSCSADGLRHRHIRRCLLVVVLHAGAILR